MNKTKIEWTERTWNPVTGCTKVSPGCKHCYAERMARRLAGRAGYDKDDPFKVRVHLNRLEAPLHWRKPSRIFVCSMSDLFHGDIGPRDREHILCVMRAANWHTYQVLTKRPHLIEHREAYLFDSHMWLGTSVESQDYVDRIRSLQYPKAHPRNTFISFEPLLGPVERMDLSGVRWAIVGGESGPGARPMDPDWARRIRDLCALCKIPFFMKQMSACGNREYKKFSAFPVDLQIREYPKEMQSGK